MPTASFLHPLLSGPLHAFSYKQFRLLWGATFFSNNAYFMALIVRGWLVLDRMDASPFMVTATYAISLLPTLLFAPLGGAIADRLNRRTIIVVAEVANFAFILTLALLLLTNHIQLWHVFVLASLNGSAFAISMPARVAAAPTMVSPRDFANAAALFSLTFAASQLVGMTAAGYLIDWHGTGIALLVSSLLQIPVVIILLFMHFPEPPKDPEHPLTGSVLRNVWEGLAYVRQRPLLLGLMLLGLATAIFAVSHQSVLPIFARDILDVGPDGLGLLAASAGLGALAGSFTVAAFTRPRQINFLLFFGGLGIGVSLIFFALSTHFALSIALMVLVGFMMQTFFVSEFTLVQMSSPYYIRGRIVGILMLTIGVGPVGMLLLGTVAGVLGPVAALALMGICALTLITTIGLAIPDLRRVEVILKKQ